MDLQKIIDSIFFSSRSPEGKEKSNNLSGHGAKGRICSPDMLVFGKRVYPSRITKTDLRFLRNNLEKIVSSPGPRPNAIQVIDHLFIPGSGAYTYLDFLIERLTQIQEYAINFAAPEEREELKNEIIGCELELSLFNPQNPTIAIEVFPKIKGFPTDEFFGSRIYTEFKILQTNPVPIIKKPADVSLFLKIAYAENINELRSDNYSQEEAEKIITDIWQHETGPIKITKEFFIFSFIMRIAYETFAITKSYKDSWPNFLNSIDDNPIIIIPNIR